MSEPKLTLLSDEELLCLDAEEAIRHYQELYPHKDNAHRWSDRAMMLGLRAAVARAQRDLDAKALATVCREHYDQELAGLDALMKAKFALVAERAAAEALATAAKTLTDIWRADELLPWGVMYDLQTARILWEESRGRMLKPLGDGHMSDCAQHNEPAVANGPCDCKYSGLLDNQTIGDAWGDVVTRGGNQWECILAVARAQLAKDTRALAAERKTGEALVAAIHTMGTWSECVEIALRAREESHRTDAS